MKTGLFTSLGASGGITADHQPLHVAPLCVGKKEKIKREVART